MAAPPSTTTFSTSDEAFKYPLPTVRQFQKQIQVALDEKNARLRTLVGGSYRQLLGTAEMIVNMRRDIEIAEGKLARVAEGCGRSAVGKRVYGLGKLGAGRDVDAGDKADLGWVARMKVLSGCVLVVGRLLRAKDEGGEEHGQSRGRMLVTTAKVLVLSRLLIKSLGNEVNGGNTAVDGTEDLVEEMRRKLRGLRRRLLRGVERMLEKVDEDREELAQALCAYSLATSSGAKDVLRHFLHVRGEAMALAFDEGAEAERGGKEESVMRALGLYTRTLLDAQALVPRRLSDALLGLKGKPLVKDDTIRGLEGLRLDICERWFGDEVMFFTPYIRHDELDGSQAAEMLKGWAEKGSEVLLHGFEKTLGGIAEFKAVVELRTKIFEGWIREGGKVKGFDSSIMLDGLRKVVYNRMISLIEARIAKLHLIGTEIEAVLDSWASAVTKKQSSLWDGELLDMELTDGAGDFKKAIISTVHGRNNAVSRVINGYKTWRHLIDELVTIVDRLKTQRWDEDLDSLEDDETLENRNTLLTKDDPHMLQDRMDASLELAYKHLYEKVATLLAAHKDSGHAGAIAIFILRVLRDIRAALPKRPNLESFGLSMIPALRSTLAAGVLSDPIASFTNSVSGRKRVVGRALWEGNPELPVLPSPSTFRLLHSITSSMMSAGSDLWSPTTVNVLKDHLSKRLGQEWRKILDSLDDKSGVLANGRKQEDTEDSNKTGTPADAETNGNIKAAREHQTKLQEILIQSLFDVIVLQRCLLPLSAGNSDDGLVGVERSLRSRIDLASPLMNRLQQAGQEYWKRTSLLFGLLA